MALESLSDTPPPLVSKGNNDSDIPANSNSNNRLTSTGEQVVDLTIEEETPNDEGELEDGEIDGDSDHDSDVELVDPEEQKRIKKRQKNKERRKRRKEEKKMQALQAWAMAMAAGAMGLPEEGALEELEGPPSEEDDDDEEEEEEELKEEPQDDMPPEQRFPSKKKSKQPRKRQREPSRSDSEEEYTKLLKKEMSRHKLKRKSSGESSTEERRDRNASRYDSGGDAPIHHEEGSEGEDYETSHRSKKKKRKKHKHHHRSKHQSKKRREQEMSEGEQDDDDEDNDRMQQRHSRRHPDHHPDHHQDHHRDGQNQYQQQFMQELSEQDQQIMMDQEMGKVHVPKTHLICKFFLENKCKKGLDCSYTHEGTIPKRPEQCKFYLQGFCSKGPLCMFLHQEYPCKYYHTGQICYSEEKCRFSHEPLKDDLRPLLDMMRMETKGRDRESDQPPLLPSPEKRPNVPFQQGSPAGGKPQMPAAKSNAIPSLFDIKVKPVGEKGQIILEKERKGMLDLGDDEDGPSSFYGAEKEVHHQDNHRGPSNMQDKSRGYNHDGRPPMGSPLRRQSQTKHGFSPFQEHFEPPKIIKVEPSENVSSPKRDEPAPTNYHYASRGPEAEKGAHASEKPAVPLAHHASEKPAVPLAQGLAQEEVKTEAQANKTSDPPVEEKEAVESTTSQVPAEEGEINPALLDQADSKAPTPAPPVGAPPVGAPPVGAPPVGAPPVGAPPVAVPAPVPVVKPPKSMPAKSKALFMRIQQNQSKLNSGRKGKEDFVEENKEADADDNWYSSDDEDATKKPANEAAVKSAPTPQLRLNMDEANNFIAAPSAISPEASNRGPLLSTVLIANNNKQNSEATQQTQLPGALASLFSNAPTPTNRAAQQALPLNIFDLVTKGTSSVQKSGNPQVQDLFANILPKNEPPLQDDNYRLLECIRDPHLKDPRDGRERKSKAGMLFRLLKWRMNEHSVSDLEDNRPSLPPIELTTPTEMKSPPAFPTQTDARTQAMVDVIKKVINEVRAAPPVSRQRPVDPRAPPQDLRPFQNDPRAQPVNYLPGHPPQMDPRNIVRPPHPMPMQPPLMQHGPPAPRPLGPPPQRPRGPPPQGLHGPRLQGPHGPRLQGPHGPRPQGPHGPHPQGPHSPHLQRPHGLPPQRIRGPPPLRGPHAPGPGFARHPMDNPSQSFPPRMPRSPQPQVPTGFSTPRFSTRGARGPHPMRPELRARMPHRPIRPILQPPFASPPRGLPPQHNRMPSPHGPRYGNPRMVMPESPTGDGPMEARDPRTAGRKGTMDPRLAKRGPQTAAPPTSDVDMRVVKDPRLARLQEPSGFSGGPAVAPGPVQPVSGDVDMRQLNSPPTGVVDTYKDMVPSEPGRGRIDPRQAARGLNTTNDVDLRQKLPPGGGGEHGLGAADSDMPLKDMFKGRDPTASPFV